MTVFHRQDPSRTATRRERPRPTLTPAGAVAAVRFGPWRSVVVALLGAALLALGPLAPAAAHDQLVSTTPDAEATLGAAPESVTLTYSGNVMDIGHEIHVRDASGQDVNRGESTVSGKTVTQPLQDLGAKDESYTVTWRVVSEDGHPIEGRFGFTVGSGATQPPQTSGSPTTQATSPDTAAPADDAGSASDGGLPGWVVPVLGGAGALVVLIVIVLVATRPKQR